MGEVVTLKQAVATTAVMENVIEYAATGTLTVVFGRIENGASDPHATASAVTRGVGRAHDTSLQNVQTAIR